MCSGPTCRAALRGTPTGLSENDGQLESRSTNPIIEPTHELQDSSQRQVFGPLLSWRVWPSYLYLPLLLQLFIVLPIAAYGRYRIVHPSEMIVDAITFSKPDFQLVLQLARQNPIPADWQSLSADEVGQLESLDLTGFRLITDTRILDAHVYRPESSSTKHQVVTYQPVVARRVDGEKPADGENVGRRGQFRIQQSSRTNEVTVRSSSFDLDPVFRVVPSVSSCGQCFELRPVFRVAASVSNRGENGYSYEAEFDISSVPTGDDFAVGFESRTRGVQGRGDNDRRLSFPIIAPTDVATMWAFLLGKADRDLRLVMCDRDQPSVVESVDSTYRFDVSIRRIDSTRRMDRCSTGWSLHPRKLHLRMHVESLELSLPSDVG